MGVCMTELQERTSHQTEGLPPRCHGADHTETGRPGTLWIPTTCPSGRGASAAGTCLASYPGAASTSPFSMASMARSGTHSIRRQQTRCQRQLPWVSTVSRGTSTPRISSEEKRRVP